jgi:hypothetical protein
MTPIELTPFEKTFYSNKWYYGLVELLQYGIFILLIYKYNPFNITNNHPAFTNLLVLFVSFLYVALFYFLKERGAGAGTSTGAGTSAAGTSASAGTTMPTESLFLIKTIKTVGAFVVFVFLTLGIVWLFKHLSLLTALLHHGMLVLIILVISGIIYILSKPVINNILDKAKNEHVSFISFIINLIIFVPCLLEQLMMYIKKQYNLTTKPVWMLLLCEVILVSLWVIVPILFQKITTHDGKVLLSDPVYLNEEHTLGTFENLHANTINNKFKYHYSLSSWIYINPQPPNTSSAYTKYTSLLNYGNKPNIQYNGKLNSLRVMAQIGNAGDLVEIFETKNIIYQKWNNIVINYDGGNMDVFLNGELVGSKPNVAPYMTYENIVAGSTDGIHGGIRNVTYYNSIMKASTVSLLNLLGKG